MKPKKKNPTRLRTLKIDEISLVDAGANADCTVQLYKRRGGLSSLLSKVRDRLQGRSTVLVRSAVVLKALEDAAQSIHEDSSLTAEQQEQALAKSVEQFLASTTAETETTMKRSEVKALRDRLSKALTEEEGEDLDIEIGKAGDDDDDEPEVDVDKGDDDDDLDLDDEPVGKAGDDDDDEAIMKSLPPSIRQRLQKADETAERLAKVEAANKRRDSIAKAKELLGDISAEPEDVAKILEILPAAEQRVFRSLIAKHRAVLKNANLFGELGSNDGAEVTAESEIGKAAAELRRADPKLSESQAIAKALENDPDLYEAAELARVG